MKLQRKLTNREWADVVALGPGVRNYRGKRTLFYNGERLWDEDDEEQWLIYDKEERQTWKVIIVLPGVEVIPDSTFEECDNVEIVIMADTVKRIERMAFFNCYSLVFIKLSRNLEYIGIAAFRCCQSLTSIYIPPLCREICNRAFWGCRKLIILSIPQTIELGDNVIANTKLIKSSHFSEDELQIDIIGNYEINEEVNAWIKNVNGNDEKYALHRACSSFNPMTDIIYGIVKRQGLKSFHKKNAIGITPLQYLEENPFGEIEQQKLMKRFILEMMGEAV